jgi:oligoribonuclease
MAQDSTYLIWIDMEMSGLKPDSDRILEVAMVITDQNLSVVAEGPVRAVHQSDELLDAMDSWNRATHARSGLTERVRASMLTETQVEAEMVSFLKQHLPAGVSPMCGNSICQDRRFLARYMPDLESYFHYRNLDVSTLKELARRWKPDVAAGLAKHGKHEALADVYESIEELRYYREKFLRLDVK